MKLKMFLGCIFLTFLGVLINLNENHKEYYTNLLKEKTENIILGDSTPRGRILDRNGKVLVDNVGVLNIVYHKDVHSTTKEELDIARTLSSFVTECKVSTTDLKNYYLVTHENGNSFITKEEWKLWEERKLTNEDINRLKWERITEENLNYSEEEQKVIYLYTKMQEGYSYQDKFLFREVTDDFTATILNLKIPSISVKITSKRSYPYQDTLRSIFGSVGSIPKENLQEFLDQGYFISDTVGVSGLESMYEKELSGKKAKYFLNSDNTLSLIEKEIPGKDITLNIDIDIQLQLEAIMKEEMNLAHTKITSKYFKEAYAFIGDPLTGGVIAMSGLQRKDNGEFLDITITAFTSSYVMGSVVKGASNTVGYLSGGITPGKKILDSCIKLYSEPSKCSYTSLGYVDDITALKTSSNYFQFLTSIQSTGQTYTYNMKFEVTEEDFDRYRNIFKEYGLGNSTGIDYPKEQTGMKGTKIAGDLLLNFAIGQYDTYTPISLLQYINTIANAGARYALRIKKEENNILLNQVALEKSFYDRIQEGMYQVFHGGTASSYVNYSLQAVGKTGTSETFYDSNQDGVVDTPVINSTVVFYYPRENPKYSMVVVAPNITDNSSYNYPFTKNVSLKMTNYLPF